MLKSVPAAMFGSVVLLWPDCSEIGADEPGATAPCSLGLVPDVFDDEPSELRAALERDSTDQDLEPEHAPGWRFSDQ